MAPPEPHRVVVHDRDLVIETMRASGSGGQHLQKTDSAVRIRHLPTGIEVRCESERSQSANRETALAILRARIVEHEQRRRDDERAADRRRQVGSGQRGDKRRTIRTQDDQVVDHVDGRAWTFRRYVRGDW